MYSYRNSFPITILLVILIFMAVYALLFFFYTNEELIWIRHSKELKERCACRYPEKNKMLFIDGSTTLFGIRTLDIEKRLGIHACNMALHAGLGLEFMIEETKPFMKRGDIVVLPLALPIYYDDERYSKLSFDYYRLYKKEGLSRIPVLEQIKFISYNNPVEAAYWTIKAKLLDPKTVGYGYINQNQNGDHTGHRENKAVSLHPDKLKGSFAETHTMRVIVRFNGWCEERGIRLYMSFGPLVDLPEHRGARMREYFAELMKYLKSKNLRVLGNPSDFLYDRKLIYDTIYHLNEKGMSMRTDQFIEILRRDSGIAVFIEGNRLPRRLHAAYLADPGEG